jgi:hypothetical protein
LCVEVRCSTSHILPCELGPISIYRLLHIFKAFGVLEVVSLFSQPIFSCLYGAFGIKDRTQRGW